MDKLIELKDGFVAEVNYDTESWGGCETCDYGSSYINEYVFVFDCGLSSVLSVKNMYEYALSEGIMMRILLNNADSFKEIKKANFKEELIKIIKLNESLWLDNWRVEFE